MRSVWSGTLAFGQVTIPVGVVISASRESSGFRLLHAACGTPVSQKRRCPACDVELPSQSEVVSGYEFATGQFAVFTNGELEQALGSKTIALDRFVRPVDIPPEYVDRAHWLVPARDVYAESAYAVLRSALDELKLGGLGQIVMQTKELPCLITAHPDERVLMLQTLYLPAQVRSPVDTWKRIAVAEISDELLALARDAVESRTAFAFRPSRLARWFAPRLPEIVKAKASGSKSVSVPEPNRSAPRDLETALKRSVKRSKRRVQ